MSNQVNKKYIRYQFEQINRESNISKNSSQVQMQSPLLIITSKDAEILLTEKNNGFKVKIIRLMFRYKEVIKRIPIIGRIIIKKKNSMIRAKMNTNTGNINLQLASIIRLNFDDFIRQAYLILFGREADPQGILEYRQHLYNGASNKAIAYLLIMSDEFKHHYNISNLRIYKKEYLKYRRSRLWCKIPVIRNFIKVNQLSYKIKSLSNQMDYISDRLNNSIQRIENNNIERNYNVSNQLSKLVHDVNNVENLFANVTEKLIDEINILDKRYSDILNNLNNDIKSNIYIGTALSQKMDQLPNFIEQNNLKNKSMVTSLPGGVTAVHVGDFIMGIPSEEWGLAMYLSLHGHFEPGSENLYCSLLKEGMTVIDVGANLGIYTLHALKAGCKVYSYEPTPSTFDILNQNIKVNGFIESQRAFTYNFAVGDSEKLLTFSICKGISGHNHIAVEDDVENTIKVPVVSLDNKHKDEKIDFIKIDIEGAEYEALIGMKEIIKNNPDIMLLIEFAPSLIKRAGVNPKDLIDLIYEYGLTIQKIDEYTSQLCDISEDELLSENSVNLLLSFSKKNDLND